jgi:hypothetical protein
MHRGHVAPISTLALAATLTLGAMLVAPDARAEPVHESGHRSYTFAVIGDVPYGDPAQAHFPAFVAGINADPDVQMVTHLGDIKSGSTTCDDQRFATVRKDFDGLEDPLVYTPGDNEWTDCHRTRRTSGTPVAGCRSRLCTSWAATTTSPPGPGSAPRPRPASRSRRSGTGWSRTS